DGATARVPYRYLVETATPLDLTVGLGGPAEMDLDLTGSTPTLYGVSIFSLTNVDTPYVHIEFGVPHLAPNPKLAGFQLPDGSITTGERLSYSTNLMGTPRLASVPWDTLNPVINESGLLVTSGFAYDFLASSFAARSFSVQPYPELAAILKANPNFFESFL